MIGHRFTRLVVASALALGAMLPSGSAPAVATHPTTALLPDLAMLQPADFRVERKPGGKRWLRFSTTIVNIGDGAFDVYGYERSGGPIGSSSILGVTQRIQNGDGTWSEHGTTADMFYSGDGHDHWHVEGLQDWDLTHEGTPKNVLATGAKTGFCFWDNVDLPEFDTPKQYEGTWACHLDADGTRVPMGLAVGWGDKYPWNIAFQYIDITTLPYGEYCLTLEADRDREFVEKTTDNNTTRTLINIQSGGVTVLATDCTVDTTAPVAPTDLAATAGDGSVALHWTANSEGDLAGYNVYRSETAGSGHTKLNSSGLVTTNAYTDTAVTDGTTYYYVVTAVDTAGNESANSNEASATAQGSSGGSTTMHVGDLDGGSTSQGSTWTATVTITVHDAGESAVSDATVSGTFTYNGSSVADSCTTVGGSCTVTLSGVHKRNSGVTFTVGNITKTDWTYDSSANHDPDGDSNGTSITVSKP